MTSNHHCTAKALGPNSVVRTEEACRQLMVSLYGSEAEARRVANALLREISPQEEELLQRRYDAGDELACQIAQESTG